jgi:hypothetical protein
VGYRAYGSSEGGVQGRFAAGNGNRNVASPGRMRKFPKENVKVRMCNV